MNKTKAKRIDNRAIRRNKHREVSRLLWKATNGQRKLSVEEDVVDEIRAIVEPSGVYIDEQTEHIRADEAGEEPTSDPSPKAVPYTD